MENLGGNEEKGKEEGKKGREREKRRKGKREARENGKMERVKKGNCNREEENLKWKGEKGIRYENTNH